MPKVPKQSKHSWYKKLSHSSHCRTYRGPADASVALQSCPVCELSYITGVTRYYCNTQSHIKRTPRHQERLSAGTKCESRRENKTICRRCEIFKTKIAVIWKRRSETSSYWSSVSINLYSCQKTEAWKSTAARSARQESPRSIISCWSHDRLSGCQTTACLMEFTFPSDWWRQTDQLRRLILMFTTLLKLQKVDDTVGEE